MFLNWSSGRGGGAKWNNKSNNYQNLGKNRFDRKIAKQLHEVIPTTQMYHGCIPRLFLLLPNHMEEKHLNIRFWWGILYNRVWNNFSQCCITPYTIFITSSEIIILYTNLINIYYQSFCCIYMLPVQELKNIFHLGLGGGVDLHFCTSRLIVANWSVVFGKKNYKLRIWMTFSTPWMSMKNDKRRQVNKMCCNTND